MLGCGSIGRRHATNLVARPDAIVAVYDKEPERSRQLATDVGATLAATIGDVWTWHPDAVVVAAPSFLHVRLAQQAADHGCHLFIEKPLGDSLDGVDALIAAATTQSLVTLVACNMRFHPGPATVKRLLDDGAVGQVIAARVQTGSYLPSWRPNTDFRRSYSAHPAQGGGAILDCIHEIDLALWYFGAARLSAASVRPARSLGLDIDGVAELLLDHSSGVLSSVHLNVVQRDYRRTCQVIGERGTIYWDAAEPAVIVDCGNGARARIALDASWTVNQMYIDEMSHFIECVGERRATVAPLDAGVRALEIALAARAHLPRAAKGVPT